MRGLNILQYKEPEGEETPSFDFKKWVADTGKSEGFEEYAYLDSRGILTIGHGFNLQDPATRKKLQSRGYDVDGMIKGKVKMTEAQSLPLLEEIYKESFETAKTKFSNFDAFPESAKHVVTDMIYNMGESRFDGFKKFKAALEAGDFTQAGKEIADSSYAKQVKGRATRHIDRFKELSGDPDLSKFFPREEIPRVNAPMRELTSVSPSTPTPEVMPVRNTQEPVGYTEPPIDSTDTYVWTPSGKMSVTDFVNRYGEKVYESTFKSPVPKFATGGKVGPGDEKNKGVRSTERVAQTGEFEGFESSVYQDDYGNNTIGYGFNIDNPNIRRTLEKQGFDVQGMLEGRVQMTREEALPVLDLLYNDAYKNVTRRFSNFNTLNPNAQYVLVDMMYNLGTKKFDTFKKMQAAVKANDFKTAALEIEDSNYYRQTGNRAKAHVENMWQAGKTYEIQQKYKGITGQGLADLELQQLNQSTYAPVSTGVSLPPMKKHGGLTLSYWKDLDKQYYVNSDRTPREYKSGGWTDLDRRYGYYGQYPGYAYGSHVVHGGPTWPEYAMGLDSGATLHQTLNVLRGNPKPKILDTSAQGNMPKKAEYPSYYSQGVKKYSLPEEGRSLYGDGDTVDLKLPSNKKTVKSGMNLEGYLARYPIPTPGFNIIGGMNPMYYGNRFSVGPYLTGHAGTEGIGFNDYGIRGTYNLGKNLSVGTDLNPQGVRAGVQYKFEKGGSLTDEYRRVRSTIPRVSFDAPSKMYTGPTTQRGITFADGGPLGQYQREQSQTGFIGPEEETKSAVVRQIGVDAEGNPIQRPTTGYYLPTIDITAEKEDTYNNYMADKYRDAGLGEALFMAPLDYVFGYPQAAMTKLLSGKYQLPSEAMGIENPYGAIAMDILLDPANLVGAGLLTKDAALARLAASKESGLLSNAWRLNPKAYQYNLPGNTMWRGIGREGMEDAIQSGVFRAKQLNYPEKRSLAQIINSPKQFGRAYFTPKFNTAATYGDNFIAEVPRDAAQWRKRYGRRDWSQIADRDIPISEGRILQKDWLRGYREVPKKEKGGMIKRADGSYSPRGLWDNIRANRGSGKEPTKEMLEQERKIRAAEKKADGSFVGIEPMTNLNIAEPRYNKTPDKAVMPVVYANEPNTPDWSKGAKFADGGYTNKNKNNWLDNL